MGPMLLKSYYSSPRMGLSKAQQKLFTHLFQAIKTHPEKSEKCLGHFFYYGPYSRNPLLPILKQLHLTMQNRIFLVFGQYDWIDAERSIENLKKEKIEIPVMLMARAGHQMNYQRPFELAKFFCQRKNPKGELYLCGDREREILEGMVGPRQFDSHEYNIIKGKGIEVQQSRGPPMRF